jgi:hypothetical protein
MMADMHHHSCCQKKSQKKEEQSSSSSDSDEESEKQTSDLRVTKMNSAFKAYNETTKLRVNKFEAPASSNNSQEQKDEKS